MDKVGFITLSHYSVAGISGFSTLQPQLMTEIIPERSFNKGVGELIGVGALIRENTIGRIRYFLCYLHLRAPLIRRV